MIKQNESDVVKEQELIVLSKNGFSIEEYIAKDKDNEVRAKLCVNKQPGRVIIMGMDDVNTIIELLSVYRDNLVD